MAVTVKQVADAALSLAGKVNQRGGIDENDQAVYYGLAPAYMAAIQYEIAVAENLDTSTLTPPQSLANALSISDADALQIAPEGLAAKFALYDRDTDMFSALSQQYYNDLNSICPGFTDIEDSYGFLDDPDVMASE